jgi:hypothetical protein
MILIKQGCWLYPESTLLLCSSRRLCVDFKTVKFSLLHQSGRCDILSGRLTVQATSVQTTRTFRPDLPLCQEALNCSKLHPSGRLSNTSGRRSVFDQLWDFSPKNRYGKTATTARTMCLPVRTISFIRQVVHTKFNCPDVILHGPDAQASYMEIASINSIVRMLGQHRPNAALFKKEYHANLESRLHSCPSGRLMSTVWTAPRKT